MSRSVNMVLAGFGGQGVLFAGKLIAYAGLLEDREVSWLPSYGPEMRGGTANCSVCLSDDPIGSPLVLAPDVLVAMNQPSLDKFEASVAEGGIVVADSTLVQRIPEIEGVRMCAIPRRPWPRRPASRSWRTSSLPASCSPRRASARRRPSGRPSRSACRQEDGDARHEQTGPATGNRRVRSDHGS